MAEEMSQHAAYYLQQEQKRDKIMADKLASQKKRFADYEFVKIVNKKFILFKKEDFTEEDNNLGMSYRIDFYVGNTCCNIFTNEAHIEESIKEITEKFSR